MMRAGKDYLTRQMTSLRGRLSRVRLPAREIKTPPVKSQSLAKPTKPK